MQSIESVDKNPHTAAHTQTRSEVISCCMVLSPCSQRRPGAVISRGIQCPPHLSTGRNQDSAYLRLTDTLILFDFTARAACLLHPCSAAVTFISCYQRQRKLFVSLCQRALSFLVSSSSRVFMVQDGCVCQD